jgi:hypothetical protein
VPKSIAIVQSNYIPWKGYFDLINMVDEFVLFDDVQYTRRDWRNRNTIKTANGPLWLTIPVDTKGRYLQKISETTIVDDTWSQKHWRSIVHNYRQAPGFRYYHDRLEELYGGATGRSLSLTNHRFLSRICEWLGMTTRLTWSSDYQLDEERTRRLVGICRQAGADLYISGPSARAYLDEAMFASEGIAVDYVDYGGYREYPQLHPPFRHDVSVIDLLLNTGADAPRYLKSMVGEAV